MHNLRMLTVTNDELFLDQFRQRIEEQVGSGQPIVAARTIDEACCLFQTVKPRLVIVHWNRENGHVEQLDRLLWLTTVQTRSVPVIVIVDRYRVDQATMLYRLGVSEYLSRAQHLDQLGSVVAAYFQPVFSEPKQAELPASVAPAPNVWSLAKVAPPPAVQAV